MEYNKRYLYSTITFLGNEDDLNTVINLFKLPRPYIYNKVILRPAKGELVILLKTDQQPLQRLNMICDNLPDLKIEAKGNWTEGQKQYTYWKTFDKKHEAS